MEKKIKVDIDKEVRNMGIIFLVLGVLHFILSDFLDPSWGIVLIAVGIIAFFYRSRNMLLILGIMLILVGILNMSSFVLYPDEVSGGWGIFSIIQFVWGIQEINKFRKVKENPKYNIREKKKKDFVWYGLRVGFYIMIFFWAYSALFLWETADYTSLFILIWIISFLFTFVVSIIHLVKYNNKAFAILSLVLSFYLISTSIIGIGIELGTPLPDEQTSNDNLIAYVNSSCYNFCLEVREAITYDYGYNNETDEVECYCLDDNSELITWGNIPLEE